MDAVSNVDVIQKLNENLITFYEENIFTDIDVVVRNERISAHKVVLASASDYFKNRIKKDTVEIVIEDADDISISAIKNVIKYMYTGSIDMNHTGDMWKFIDLIQLNSFKEFFIKYFAENFERVSQKKYFTDITLDILLELLQSEELNASEEMIFEGFRLWINKDLSSRKQHFPILLRNMDLRALSENFLLKKVDPVCKDCNESRSLILDALVWKKIPERRDELAFICNKPRVLKESLVVMQLMKISEIFFLVCEVLDWKTNLWLTFKIKMDIISCTDFYSVFWQDKLIIQIDKEIFSVNLKTKTVKNFPKYNSDNFQLLSVHNENLYMYSGNKIVKWDNKNRAYCTINCIPNDSYGYDINYYLMSGSMIFKIPDKLSTTMKIFVVNSNHWCKGPVIKFNNTFFGEVVDDNFYFIDSNFQKLNLKSNERKTLKKFPTTLPYPRSVIYDGKIICTGGESSKSVYQYDFDDDDWKKFPPLNCKLENRNHRLLNIPSRFLPKMSEIRNDSLYNTSSNLDVNQPII